MADKDTSEYASTKAPEIQEHAQERKGNYEDWRLIPGGIHGSAHPQGMDALDRDVLPNGATTSGLTDSSATPSEANTKLNLPR